MSLHLYELSEHYLKALDFLTDPENEIDQQAAVDTIESLDGELDDKLINVARTIANFEAEAKAVKEVEERQAKRRKSLEAKTKWLRDYLVFHMSNTGHTKLAAPDISLSLAKLPASVQVDDEGVIPAEFWHEEVVRKLDKTLIKQANGCPGARVESGGFRVSIK